jgi:hypothetical protein
MVKPTISVKPVKAQKASSNLPTLRGDALINRVKTDEAFRNIVLQNTANRLAEKGSFVDVTYKGLTETGKSFRIAFNGQESSSKYIIVPYKDSAVFMSSRVLSFKRQ